MEEIIYVVDEKDQFVRKATRTEVEENALLHRTSRVIILNNENKFLLQKRSSKKSMYPSYWDIGMAGTVIEGDSYVETAIRELKEELGIYGISNIQMMHSFTFKIRYNSNDINAHYKVYELIYYGKIKIQEEEIDEVKYLTEEEVIKLIENEKFHPVGELIFKKYLEIKK